jgi:hypothetical protein
MLSYRLNRRTGCSARMVLSGSRGTGLRVVCRCRKLIWRFLALSQEHYTDSGAGVSFRAIWFVASFFRYEVIIAHILGLRRRTVRPRGR